MREGSSFSDQAARDFLQKSSLGLGQYRGRKCERGEHFDAPSLAGGESMQQKSSLGLSQYRGRKCERGHRFEARERPRQARRRRGGEEDGTRSLKREPTHQRMVGKIKEK